MKKVFLVLSLIMICSFFVVACGGNSNLQTEQSSYGIIDFYYNNYIQNYLSEYELANSNSTQLKNTDKTHVQNLYAYTQKSIEQELCVLAGIDYFESLQSGNAKLWKYSLTLGEDKIDINVESEPTTPERKIELYKNDNKVLLIAAVISHDNDNNTYTVNYKYCEKNSKMVVTYKQKVGTLLLSINSRAPLNLDENTYQEFEATKNIYQLGSKIKYYDTQYNVKNAAGKQNGGKYSVEGYSQNVEGKLKFSYQNEAKADYSITSLMKSELACHLSNDANSLIFESDENKTNTSRYAWNAFGESTSWKNLVG